MIKKNSQDFIKCGKCGKVYPREGFLNRRLKLNDYTCRKCLREYKRENRKRPSVKKRHNEYNRLYKQSYRAAGRRDKNKRNANDAVSRAIKNGVLEHPTKLPCSLCSNSAIEYHHGSYKKIDYLQVVAVCKPCHSILDGKTIITAPVVA